MLLAETSDEEDSAGSEPDAETEQMRRYYKFR